MSSWKHTDWNQRLLAHYFGIATSGSDRPVTSLCVLDEEFARVHGAGGRGARAAFIACMRETLQRTSSDLFGHALAQIGDWTTRIDDQPPPFVAHLVLSCLIASDLDDADVPRDEGDYSVRLAKIAGSHARHDPAQLPLLWRSLQEWLVRTNGLRTRPTYRELVLPDPGGLTRIGYSKRLAFPANRDLGALRRVLGGLDQDARDAGTARILYAVRSKRSEFSREFVEQLDAFEGSLQSGDAAAGWSPFWGAVQRALVGAADATANGVPDRRNFTLLAEDTEDGLSYIVCADGAADLPGTESTELSAPVGRWSHRVGAKPGANETLVARVLSGATPLPGIAPYVKAGVVPLADEHCRLTIAQDPSIPVDVYLVRSSVEKAFEKLIDPSKRGRARASNQSGWKEYAGAKIRNATRETLRECGLERASFLAEQTNRARVTARGGIRLLDGFLALKGFCPRFGSGGATSLTLEPRGDELRAPIELVDEGGGFALPADVEPSAGEWVVRTSSADVSPLRVRFTSHLPLMALAKSHGDELLKEGVRDELAAAAPEPWLAERMNPRPALVGGDARRHVSTSQVSSSPADGTRTLAEAIAAMRMRETSIPFSVWNEMLTTLPELQDARLLLSRVTRAWCEAGHIDLLVSPSRRAVRIAPRPPQLVVVGATECRLVGAAGRELVRKARETVGALRFGVDEVVSSSPFVAPVPRYRFRDRGEPDFRSAADSIGVPLVYVNHDIVREPDRVLGEAPLNHETQLSQRVASGASVEQRHHPHRSNYWAFTKAGRVLYWSHIRNLVWLRADTSDFVAGQGPLESSRMYLPLPLARLLATTQGHLPGPHPSDPSRYRYPCSAHWREWFVRKLNEVMR